MKVSRLSILIVLALVLAACGGGTTSAPAQKVSLTALDPFKFDPAAMIVKVGQPVEIALQNKGVLEHSFVIDELAVSLGPVAGGQSASTTFTPGAAGTYPFYCNVPGHKEAGMTGSLTISP